MGCLLKAEEDADIINAENKLRPEQFFWFGI
jgi:hypothetical protein